MKINRNNYEAYFIDFIERNLSEEDTSMFMLFLEQNPDLKTELEEFENINLIEEKEEFAFDPSLLKRTAVDADVLLCIDYIENALSPKEEKALNKRLETDSEFANLLKTVQGTILSPDPGIKYPGKRKLKKTSPVITLLFYGSAAAACIALAFFIFNSPQQTQPDMHIAIAKSKAVSEKTTTIVARKPAVSGTSKINFFSKTISTEELRERPEIEKIDALGANEIERPKAEEIDIVMLEIPESGPNTDDKPTEYIPVKDYLASLIKKKASSIVTDNGISTKEPTSLSDLAGLGLDGLSRLTGINMGFQKKELASARETSFKLGPFEISRSHQKK